MDNKQALAVVREALRAARWTAYMEDNEPQRADALAALALIEQEMERLFRENNRLGKALAYERSGIAARRVAELEAALHPFVEMGDQLPFGWKPYVLSARRALVGNDE